MKKNKTMRLASVLLVLTLLTTSVIGGTFAKYVTSDSGYDMARVAKFGVVATVDGNLFSSSYKPVGDGNTAQAWAVNKDTVSANVADQAVVAPGTKSDGPMIFAAKGTPEVSTKLFFDNAKNAEGKDAKLANVEPMLVKNTYGVLVEVDTTLTPADALALATAGKLYYETKNATGTEYDQVTATDASAWNNAPDDGKKLWVLVDKTDDTKFTADYFPLKWMANGAAIDAATDLKTAMAAIKTAMTTTTEFKPNEEINASASLAWEWPFGDAYTGTEESIYSANGQDQPDTILGDLIALNADGKFVLNDSTSPKNAVVAKIDGTTAHQLKTAEVKAYADGDDTLQKVWVAYDASAGSVPTQALTDREDPTAVQSGVLAILSVCVQGSATVVQVD